MRTISTSAPVILVAVALLPPPLLLSTNVGLAQQEDALTRPISVGERSLPAFSAFQDALQTSGVPGGVAFVEGCENQPKPMVRPQGTNLRELLDSITRADSQYAWRMQKGVVNFIPVKGAPALLETHVTYDSGVLTDAVSAVTVLSSLPEVAQTAARLGLTHNALGPGLGGVAQVPPSPSKPLGVRFHDVTLLDALNAIARANKHGVWTYRETHCGSVHQFNISFTQ